MESPTNSIFGLFSGFGCPEAVSEDDFEEALVAPFKVVVFVGDTLGELIAVGGDTFC